MKMFKSKPTTKTTKTWAWTTVLLIIVITISIFSCSEDDSINVTPSGEEAESAWITGYFVSQPEGRIWYMEATKDINSDVDINNSVELGSNAGVYSSGENVYAVSSDAKTITKWIINKSTLELDVAGLLSYASTGIDFIGDIVFKSDSEAYIYNLEEGLILQFDPSTMEITETFNFPPPANFQDAAPPLSGHGYLRDNNILMPISYFPENPDGDAAGMKATLAVFDTDTKSLTYNQDDRSLHLQAFQGLVTNDDGFNYVWPQRENAMFAHYWVNTPIDPHTVLRVDNDGNFDNSYELDLNQAIDNFSLTMRPVVAFQNEVVFTYYTTSLDNYAWDDRYNFFDNSSDARNIKINLLTGEYSIATAFDAYAEVEFQNNIDGVNYIRAYNKDYTKTWTLRQNGIDSYEQLQGLENGVIMYTNKLF
ncbi:MAG: hypothetical protein AAF992_11670 [Bacteroidota bacterium]